MAIVYVDFSKNYDNEQQHAIQSAYFGYEQSTIYYCCCLPKGRYRKDGNHNTR